MSYILDALRKADAQRERDPARGIHAHPIPSGAVAPPAASRAPWMAGAAALALALIALAGWYLARETHAPAAVDVAVSPSSSAPVSAATEVVVVAPHAVATAVMPPPPAPAAPVVHAATASSAAQLPAPSAAVAVAAPALTGLPPDAPRVAISGGVYSPSPAQRMLIVNGQVFNEGSEIAPGVAIDEIKARTAVLKFRGARYTVAY